MVEIPKFYWDFKTVDSNIYELRISEDRFNDTCDCYAHKVCGIEKDYIYVGACLGLVGSSGRLRSLPNKTPTVKKRIGEFRTAAQAKGTGYQQWNWFTQILLQNLYLISYKNLNSQTALGMGVCNGSKTNTGGTNTKGMIFGSSNKTQQVCFLGIEDFYGNIRQWVDGMFHSSSHRVLVTPDNKTFNDTGSGYKDVGDAVGTTSNVYGKINKVMGTNEGGFFPKKCKGSDTTYYCDYGDIYSGKLGNFGGSWDAGLNAGAFYLYVNYGGSSSASYFGSRLVFLGDKLQITDFTYSNNNPKSYIKIYSDEKIIEITAEYDGKTYAIPFDKEKTSFRGDVIYTDCTGEIQPDKYVNYTIKSTKETIEYSALVMPGKA